MKCLPWMFPTRLAATQHGPEIHALDGRRRCPLLTRSVKLRTGEDSDSFHFFDALPVFILQVEGIETAAQRSNPEKSATTHTGRDQEGGSVIFMTGT